MNRNTRWTEDVRERKISPRSKSIKAVVIIIHHGTIDGLNTTEQ